MTNYKNRSRTVTRLLAALLFFAAQPVGASESGYSLSGASAWEKNLAPLATVTTDNAGEGAGPEQLSDGIVSTHLWVQHKTSTVWNGKGTEATFVYTWDKPVKVSQIVFFPLRNAWYERNAALLYRIASPEHPDLAEGQFAKSSDAQSIGLPDAVEVKELTITLSLPPQKWMAKDFGVSEILFFDEPLTAAEMEGLNTSGLSESEASLELTRQVNSGMLGFNTLAVIQRHKIDPSHIYTYHVEGLRPGGGLFLVDLVSGRKTQLVDSAKGIILDQELSYDGKTLLFSWRKHIKEPFQIYTISVDGTNLRQITEGASNNFNACWLPDGGIAFLSDRKPAFAYCMTSSVPILYRMEADGTQVKRLSANYLNDFTPSVLGDGRIIYSRWEYVDRPAIPTQSLWSMRPDGTMLAGVFGNRVLAPATFMEAKQIPGTRKLLCVMTAHNGPCRGAIGMIDPAKGANAAEAIRNLTPDVTLPPMDNSVAGNFMTGPYENPFPIDSTHFLVSRLGTVQLRDLDGTAAVPLLTASPGTLGWYSPRPLAKRPMPMFLSQLPDKPRSDQATILMNNVYNGLEGYGIQQGEVKQIAVVQEIEKEQMALPKYHTFGAQFPTVSCGATYAPKKIWGYADVEADGSAHFTAPSGVPLYFLALDEHGRAIQRMRTFTHFMPGERQSCIGCHADRNSVAPGNTRPMAARQAPKELTPPAFGVRNFSYSHIVQPVLDQHCVGCHNVEEMPEALDLSGDVTDFFNVSYDNLTRRNTFSEHYMLSGRQFDPLANWIPTNNGSEKNIHIIAPKSWGSPKSRLADLLLAGHPDEDGQPRVELEPPELRRILHWIDVNVPYYATALSKLYERPGCRRLYPSELDATLKEVAERRCLQCHDDVPREFYTRIAHPERNSFLRAPLAKAAGGGGACSETVFASTQDPDYQKILAVFKETDALLQAKMRMDLVPQEVTSPCPTECESTNPAK